MCYFLGTWHLPFMGHPEQEHPQDDFPFLLSFTILITASITAATITVHTMTVTRFALNHASILKTPPFNYLIFTLLLISLWGLASIYRIVSTTAIANINPMTFMLPLKRSPN